MLHWCVNTTGHKPTKLRQKNTAKDAAAIDGDKSSRPSLLCTYAWIHTWISQKTVTCLHHSMSINITRCYCTQVCPCDTVQASVHYQSINLRPTQAINITTYYMHCIEHINNQQNQNLWYDILLNWPFCFPMQTTSRCIPSISYIHAQWLNT
jgi:hypothetical protein